MLNKLNKFKIIILFTLILLFILFFSNEVAASTNISFDYDGVSYNGVISDDFLYYTIVYCENGCFYFHGTKDSTANNAHYLSPYNAAGTPSHCLRFFDTEGNVLTEYRYKSYDGINWVYNDGGWDGLVKSLVKDFCYSNIDVYDTEDTSGNLIYKKDSPFPGLTIEYYEPYSMYYVFTDWYDVRDISLTNSYAYGKYTDYNPDDDSQWIWYDMVYEYKENEEGKKTITREGFPLNMYGYYSFLMENLKTKEWVIKGLDFSKDALVGTEYENCLDPLENLNLYLYETMANPTVYSNYINKDLLDKCKLVDFSVSFDNGESFSSINIDCKEEFVVNDITYIRFYYTLYANDVYTFKLRIFDENYNEYEVIKTFSLNSYDNIIDFDGTETTSASPFITAFADSNIIRFSTQSFKERISLNYFEDLSADTLRYTAYYIDEEAYQVFGDNYEDWILMDVCYEDYDKVTQGYPYYFKTEFSFDSLEDGDIFYFVFFDNKLGCFSQVTTYTLESKSDLYTISQNITFNNDKFQRLYSFFNEHFGFLTYPFEFIINLLTRTFNINFEEPILHFPQIINPLDDTVIFNGFDYNFNSILEYDGIAYFYNIYLIAVDCIFIVAFLFGCKHTIEEVFGNG